MKTHSRSRTRSRSRPVQRLASRIRTAVQRVIVPPAEVRKIISHVKRHAHDFDANNVEAWMAEHNGRPILFGVMQYLAKDITTAHYDETFDMLSGLLWNFLQEQAQAGNLKRVLNHKFNGISVRQFLKLLTVNSVYSLVHDYFRSAEEIGGRGHNIRSSP